METTPYHVNIKDAHVFHKNNFHSCHQPQKNIFTMTDYSGCTYVEMVIKTVALLHVHVHCLPHILNVSDPSFTPFNWRLVWINGIPFECAE